MKLMPKILLYRSLSLTLCLTLANLAMPQGLAIAVGQPIATAIQKKMAEGAAARKRMDQRRAASRTQPLTEKQMNSLQGRSAQCPYIAGASKWNPQYEGVDLVSGNYTTTATDLSFDGGYGIPVNITRSYSANDANEEPFGYGWSLGADIRTTAGGILKSKSAPVRSVPVTLKDRSPIETDPNLTAQPVDAVTANDSSGKAETIQKDADGVLSPAAWDQNTTNTTYQNVIVGTSIYQVVSSEAMTTPDGTVYVYAAEGSYTGGGTYPYGQSTAARTPANVLKCISATDRNGNTTSYRYGATPVTFQKIDGITSENPLTSVAMANQHTIYLKWGNGSAGHPLNRVVQVYDSTYGSTTPVRTVNYLYDSAGSVIQVTSPTGLNTSYGYATVASTYNSDVSNEVLTSITSPQGLTTGISYFVGLATIAPYGVTVEGVQVYQITEPSGIINSFYWNADEGYSINPNGNSPDGGPYTGGYIRKEAGTSISSLWETVSTSGPSLTVLQSLDSPNSTGPLVQSDTYDIFSENDLSSTSQSVPDANNYYADSDLLAEARLFGSSPYLGLSTTTTTTYNFLGKPLDSTLTEVEELVNKTFNTTRTATTSYAYWTATKYYQQKAVKDPGGRVSFTDYYTNTDSNLGNRGQKYQVWDPKYGGTGPGSGTGTDGWRYTVFSTPGQYSGQFNYDSKGRVTSTLKLQAATTIGAPSTYRYVTTAMTYGLDSDGSWGQAIKTVEDSGGLNRTTSVNTSANNSITTNGFTAWGKPNDSVDAVGHEFQTSFDVDGKVNYVYQVGYGNIASYSYGSSGTALAQPITVTDNITGVIQAISYVPSGTFGVGQAQSVTETRSGSVDNVCSYTYYQTGDRKIATYSNGSGAVLGQWGYYDYIGVGSPQKNTRAFQTLCKLDGNGNRTADEFHYAYDSAGRVMECAFAQTPSQSASDSGGWYDSKLASTRCRAHYEYDAGGRLYWLGHYWDTLVNGNSYSSAAILGQACNYELNSGLNRGIKTNSEYETPTSPGSSSFQISQTDSYSYDSALDYLTGASYGDGLGNANPAWTYDAAGNRNDAVTDNLNRATAISGTACTNDLLGNRLTMGSNSYGWDQVNRMKSYNTTNYTYRADGMRTYKTSSSGSTSYRYDGQMGMEDVDFASNGTVSKTTDYGIGTRGIEALYVTQNGTTSASYPIYDAHGSMISSVARQGTGSYTSSPLRTFDAWGQIRIGAQTGDPKGRFCASLGHKQDDESGLTYMRARYYEANSGRFLSEDRTRRGANWVAYCKDNPIRFHDETGRTAIDDDPEHQDLYSNDLKWFFISAFAAVAGAEIGCVQLVIAALSLSIMFGAAALGETDYDHELLTDIAKAPCFTSMIAGFASGMGMISSNAFTASILISLTTTFCAEMAALLTVDG